MKEYTFHELAQMTMTGEERFCLASEVDAVLKRQASAAKAGMHAATAISSGQLQAAARLRAESSPEALESERSANERLTQENDFLTKREADAVRIMERAHSWISIREAASPTAKGASILVSMHNYIHGRTSDSAKGES